MMPTPSGPSPRRTPSFRGPAVTGLLCVGLLPGLTLTASERPPRLAVLPLEAGLQSAADILTSTLSKDDRVALLERTQIDKVIAEQSLARVNAGDYVKVGRLLGAQGLLILEVGKENDRELLTSRLVAVNPGVVLGLSQAPWPLDDLNGWTQLIARQFDPLFPKLGVLERDAVPISILNVRAAVQSREAAPLEQALTTLLAHRLMQQPEVFVLERRQMETLGWEKELQAADASPFWSGSYLLEGTIDPEGFTKETLTLRLRLSPPKGGTPTVIDLVGPRTNLVSVANTAASRVLGGLSRSGPAPEWKPEQEAERYFEEAKWAFRWKLYREAEVAAEASWALGRMNKETAMLRVRACTVGLQDSLRRSAVEHVMRMRASPSSYGPTPPQPTYLPTATRGLELFLEGSRTLFRGEAPPDYAWYGLGVETLEAASGVLERYYNSPKERPGHADELVRLRALCREVSSLYDESPSLRENYVQIQRVRILSGAYRQEDPADAAELLRQCFRTPASVSVRRELMLSRTENSGRLRVLMAWDRKDDQRLGGLWRALVDDLAASTNTEARLDAGFLRLTDAATVRQLEDSARRMFDLILAERATVERCAEQFDYRARTLSYLRFHCADAVKPSSTRDTPPLPEQVRIMEQWIPEFERKWEESKPKVAANVVPAVATQGPPARPTNAPARGGYTAIRGKDGKTTVYPWTNGVPPAWLTNRPGFGRGPGFRPENRPPVVKEVLAEEWLVNRSWSPQAPDELLPFIQTNVSFRGAGPGRPMRTGMLQYRRLTPFSFKWRAGKVWVGVLTRGRLSEDRGFLSAVDPTSLETRSYVFPWVWKQEAELRSGVPPERCAFDVLGDQVYVAAVGQVRRFATRDQTWTEVSAPLQDVGRVVALGDRVFVTSDDSILEIDPRSLEVKVLASARRRPALNALDEVDHLRSPPIWLAGGQLRTWVQPSVFEHVPAFGRWDKVASIESPFRGGDSRGGDWPAQALADGILVNQPASQAWRRLIGLFGESRTPEVLLTEYYYDPISMRTPNYWSRPPGPEVARTNQTRWWGPPQLKLVGASASFDGTNLCCLFSAQRSNYRAGLVQLPAGAEHLTLLLTRFTVGVSSPVTIPLKLRAPPLPTPGPGFIPGSGPIQTDIELQAAPTGLLVVARTLGGFWWLPKEELEARVQVARTSAEPSPAPGPASVATP